MHAHLQRVSAGLHERRGPAATHGHKSRRLFTLLRHERDCVKRGTVKGRACPPWCPPEARRTLKRFRSSRCLPMDRPPTRPVIRRGGGSGSDEFCCTPSLAHTPCSAKRCVRICAAACGRAGLLPRRRQQRRVTQLTASCVRLDGVREGGLCTLTRRGVARQPHAHSEGPSNSRNCHPRRSGPCRGLRCRRLENSDTRRKAFRCVFRR